MPAEPPTPPITIRHGLDPDQRTEAARIYWQAFGGKLGAVLGPEARALAFLARALCPDHCYSAVDAGGRLLGVAGFKSPRGGLVDGSAAMMRATYGRPGALWRAMMLHLLVREVDNRRFLVDGIAVRRDARGRGVGSALLAALCEEAARRGFHAVRLEVIDSNWRARALYEREGFVAAHTSGTGLLRHVFGFASATTMIRTLD